MAMAMAMAHFYSSYPHGVFCQNVTYLQDRMISLECNISVNRFLHNWAHLWTKRPTKRSRLLETTHIPSVVLNLYLFYSSQQAIGKFFAISLISRQAIPLLLSRHVLKYILGRQISWHDVGFYNADLYEGLRGMLVHCQEEDLTPETFQSIYMLNFDVTINNTLCELKPEGKSIPVTPENVREYVQLYSMFLMVGCVKEELEEMSLGFHEVIPSNCTRGLTAEDLQLLLTGGSTTVSYSNLKQQTQITFLSSLLENEKINFTKNFFKLIRRMNNNQRQQLLYFSTGSALLAGGSMTLQVNVNQRGGREAPLPTAATCGRSISMPCYLNYDILKEKVSAAISCDSYAFA